MNNLKVKHPVNEIFVKDGEIIDCIALEWIEDNWDFDYPSILLNPVVKLYTDSSPVWYIIENVIEEIITVPIINCPKLVGEDIKWAEEFYEWDIKKFKRIAYNLLKGKKDGIKNRYKILHEKILFIEDKDEPGYLTYKNI